MALSFKISGKSVSGTDITVFEHDLGGQANVDLLVKNAGGQALTAAKVQVLDEASGMVLDRDITTFAELAAGAVARLNLPGPVERLRMIATCAAGTELDASVITPLGN